MDAEIAARFDQLMVGIAQQFELMKRRDDERHARLIEVIRIRFDGTDSRFEQIDQRFDEERRTTTEHFGQMRRWIDRRFHEERGKIAQQFELMERHTDSRFDDLATALDLRFGSIERRVRRLERND